MKVKNILLLALIFLAMSERVFLDLGPNIELVTVGMLLTATYLSRKYSLVFILVTMVLTDLIIGNSNIWVFTYSGFIIPALFVSLIKNKENKVLWATGAGMGSNLFFFIWTNFGVWLLGNMYSKNLLGLTESYVMAIPFLKMQIISTLIFVPITFAVIELAKDFKFSKFSSFLRQLQLQN